MKLSIISPVYYKTNKYVDELYQSLLEQTDNDWELIILLSTRGEVSNKVREDNRVKVYDDTLENNKIGRLKRKCCEYASGDIIIELDSDDMLTPTAVEDVKKAFENEDIHFVYSNSAEFNTNTWEPRTYNKWFGWRTRDFFYKDKKLLENISFPPMATTMFRIEWAPNHLRAWRKTSYFDLGGHDDELPSGDDHDLICKFYIKYGDKGFKWLDKCLYLYRLHNENYSVTDNKEVQSIVAQNYQKYSREITNKWCDTYNLRKIDIGGYRPVRNYEIVQMNELHNIPDNSVGVIKCFEQIQYYDNVVEIMENFYRILTHGGILYLEVPSTNCEMAFANPLHKSFWNNSSSLYYTEKMFADNINFKGRFQNWLTREVYPTTAHRQLNYKIIQYDFVAIKNGVILPNKQWEVK